MGKPVAGEVVVLPFPQTNEAPRGAWRNSEALRVSGFLPQRCGLVKNRVLLHGAVIEIDADSGKATAIRRVSEPRSSEH
jgi:calcineurin-like phosphoesterase